MEKLFTEYFSTLTPGEILMAFAIVGAVGWYGLKNRNMIADFFNHLYNRKKSREELLKTIHENQAEIKQIMENRLHDREQSFAIQKELTDAQKGLAESISAISDKIDDMQRSTDRRFQESEQRTNKRIRAELKDKISQSYRYYHALGKINAMELEALEDLIEEYEAAKGTNSFIHTVVQKEMYTWKRPERNENEERGKSNEKK